MEQHYKVVEFVSLFDLGIYMIYWLDNDEKLCVRKQTSVSRSEEESVEEIGEAVSKVLKEREPLRSRFLTSPTLTFSGCSPNGHPSSCIYTTQRRNINSPYGIKLTQEWRKIIKSQHSVSDKTSRLMNKITPELINQSQSVPVEPLLCPGGVLDVGVAT